MLFEIADNNTVDTIPITTNAKITIDANTVHTDMPQISLVLLLIISTV